MKAWIGRREALGRLGALGAAIVLPARVVGAANQMAGVSSQRSVNFDCTVTPRLTEGPFFFDEKLERSDLVSGTSEPFVVNGAPLLLRLGVFQVKDSACLPLPDAHVDIWHADAEGIYSDEASGRIQEKNTLGEKYLRGYQRTDRNGMVTFSTIYPGWYHGRTVHIHFKIRSAPRAKSQSYELTSQLFFDDALSDAVLARPPYNTRGRRRVRNANDGIYRRGGGSELLLNVEPASSGRGYRATFNIGLLT